MMDWIAQLTAFLALGYWFGRIHTNRLRAARERRERQWGYLSEDTMAKAAWIERQGDLAWLGVSGGQRIVVWRVILEVQERGNDLAAAARHLALPLHAVQLAYQHYSQHTEHINEEINAYRNTPIMQAGVKAMAAQPQTVLVTDDDMGEPEGSYNLFAAFIADLESEGRR